MGTLFTEERIKFDIPDAELILIENFISPDDAQRLYKDLYKNVKWELRELFMFVINTSQDKRIFLHHAILSNTFS